MPLFTYPPAPFALYSYDVDSGAATALTAGSAYLSEYVLNAPITVTQMRCGLSGAVTGNVDMGIYDSAGTNGAALNLLGHTGAIAAVTGLFTQNLTANLLLSPGRYWLAWLDTVADSVQSRQAPNTGMGVLMKTSATNLTVLPASIGTIANVNFRVNVMALLSGSWS